MLLASLYLAYWHLIRNDDYLAAYTTASPNGLRDRCHLPGVTC